MSARKRNKPRPGAAETKAGSLPSGRLLAIRALLFIALACSAYLAFLSLTGGRAVGCGPDSDCDKVLASRWAYWFGIPVSALALVVDAAFLAATFRLGPATSAADQRRAWAAIVPCAVLVTGAAVWFIVLQVAVLKSICPYCMAAHACGLGASLIALFSAPIRALPVKPWELDSVVFIVPASIRKFVLTAIFGVVALIAGQLLHQPRTFVVQQISSPAFNPANPANPTDPTNPPANSATTNPPGSSLPPAATATATTGTNAPAAAAIVSSDPVLGASDARSDARPDANDPAAKSSVRRLFPIYDGRFQIDVTELPTLGAPTNAQVIVALHDYTCHHCRVMHPVLVDAQRAFSDRLVVVSLPMPFDPACNPMMQRPNPKHTNACEYARLSLAVWRADRSRHHSYDDYLFANENVPPPIAEARQTAIQLIGASALETALSDPWVDQQLRLAISIYETAYRAGQGSMPQFIIGQSIAVGTLPKSNFMELLANNLGLTVPTPPQAPSP